MTAGEHIVLILELSAQRILQFLKIGLDEVYARFQRRKHLCPLSIDDAQRLRVHGAENFTVVAVVHAARQTAGDDRYVRTGGKVADHVQKFAELFACDLPTHIVNLRQHGLLVDKLIVLAYPAAVPDECKRNALLVQRTLKHGAVLIVHKPCRVRLTAQPCNADRNIERLSGEGQCLVFDNVHLADIE